jgi:hypothetical protein
MTDRVKRFIAEHLSSVEQLEVLLLLFRTAPRRWTATDISTELRSSPISVAGRLRELHLQKVLERDGESAFFLTDQAGALRETVGMLQDAYRAKPYTVMGLLIAKGCGAGPA